MRRVLASVILVGAAAGALAQQLPPPPAPFQNPITEPKRVLGKILFWDEQVSSFDTVACGTCHDPQAGGADRRIGVHPGPDSLTPTADDIAGSPGVVRVDASGTPIADPVFGFEVQVTRRAANSFIGAAYAPQMFWDGRAGPTFADPETGGPSLANNAALENQAVGPILSDVEMAHEGRTWADVRAKLERTLPLRDATDLPADLAAALAGGTDYPALFAVAFGDPTIDAERIAYAIATYERTLVANQTPWDRFIAGDTAAMTPGQVAGWNFFQGSPCAACHTPPTFTNHTFRALGLRPPAEDPGRQAVTGLFGDRGRFKVPTLRNVGLKDTFMHTGRLVSVQEAVLWYRPGNPARFSENLDLILPIAVPPGALPGLVNFITNGLVDPRVAAATFPFDRPTLHAGALPRLEMGGDPVTISWPALEGVQAYRIYRGALAGLTDSNSDGLPDGGYGACVSDLDPNSTDTVFVDSESPMPGSGFFYLKSVIDSTGAERGLGATSSGLPRTVLVACE